MATNIPDDKLFQFADRVKGQTVVITGAANGIGRETAIAFGRHGANVVIGDIDLKGSEETAKEVKKVGGDAVFQECNVLNYDALVSLFELALKKFGRIDVVVANAGVVEIGRLTSVQVDKQGLPIKPNLKTLEINLISVLYSSQLASHYLSNNTNKGSLRALVLIGSMGSLNGITGAPLYAASKHGILGLMRSFKEEFEMRGLRVATVCPWFADTAILPAALKVVLAGIPMTPVPKIAGAIVLAATDATPDTNGSAYTLPDEREVFRVPHVQLDEGVYKLVHNRVARLKSFAQGMITFVALVKLFVKSPVTKLLLGVVVGYKAYQIAGSRGLL